jgi:hypothetical protein
MDEAPAPETPADPADPPAKRALRRAGVHFVRAAIEVVAGIEVLIEELRTSERRPAGQSRPGLEHIAIDDEPEAPPPSPPVP